MGLDHLLQSSLGCLVKMKIVELLPQTFGVKACQLLLCSVLVGRRQLGKSETESFRDPVAGGVIKV